MDERYMREAIRLAQAAKEEGNFPFGAVVVKDREIIARGHSLERTEHNVTKHAELMAVSDACAAVGDVDFSDCILYASGEPCNMCASAAFQAGIGKVVIGATREDLSHFFRKRMIGIQELAEDSRHKVEIVEGVLNKEAVGLFDGVNRAQ